MKLLAWTWFLLLLDSSTARPQDLGTGMMLAVAQVKELVETGGGVRQEQSIEVLGQRMSGAMQMGFGEVMQPFSSGLTPLNG